MNRVLKMPFEIDDDYYPEPDWERLDTLIGDLINEPELLIEMKGLNQGSSEEREEDERS